MFDKIEVFDKRYEELNNKLYDPEVAANAEKYNSVMKELREIEPIVLKYREYKKATVSLDEAKQMLEENTDSEFRELLAEEIEAAKADIEKTSEELKILLLPKDPNDSKNVIVEIRAGAGGEESALFCYNLFRMYGMYAEKHGFKTEPIYINETELGGFKEVSFMLIGQGAYSRMKFESGVHRVQRVPETESQGRIHTSTATVAVLPEAEDVEYEINPADLKFDTFRSSGAGGQHINKTSSAVRVTHIPTGTVVECQEERSQFQNREKAVRVLKARLLNEKQQAQQSDIAAQRKAQVGTGERNERIRTYNYPQGRVTDHRIGLTLYKLDDILNGDLDEIIDALITADRANQLAIQTVQKVVFFYVKPYCAALERRGKFCFKRK
ncbi:MAG: peptide chain release factor 1 [Clostridia bacterium]|nr:peptide chain release factor 1 [Clostridia bacterium]